MITKTSTKEAILKAIDETVSQLEKEMSPLDQARVNRIPYADSWTAGQLLNHVTKSTNGMATAIAMKAKPAERDPAERIAMLKKTFLDFTLKMESPEFIVPDKGPFNQQSVVSDLLKSFDTLKAKVKDADMTELVEDLPLGPATKLELLHFVLYHTQRHLQQLKRITAVIQR